MAMQKRDQELMAEMIASGIKAAFEAEKAKAKVVHLLAEWNPFGLLPEQPPESFLIRVITSRLLSSTMAVLPLHSIRFRMKTMVVPNVTTARLEINELQPPEEANSVRC